MIDIYNVSVLDLLAPNLKQDPDILAASKAVDSEFLLIANEVNECILLPRIDDLDEDLVDLLAWQMHVDFYDNTLPIEIKRNLVKNSTRLHMIKGTKGAVEEAASMVFGRSTVEEWFEYDGAPFFFRMNIEISEQGASPENLEKLDRLINFYKNKRSWLENINIFLTTNGFLYVGGCTTSGEKITVYPWSPTEIISIGKINVGSAQQSVETTTIYPKEAS